MGEGLMHDGTVALYIQHLNLGMGIMGVQEAESRSGF